MIEQEIRKKTEIRDKLDRLKRIHFWLSERFSPMTDIMERKVMLAVHYDFNSLFKKWFGILVENELEVDLDDEFTPLIQQNNHDIDYLYLSGGEKTAIALAYRLALNQVINKLMNTIKTSDLLILDEPTDGFSEEQLDRVRILLNELELQQIIIVSHEAKVESFVDHIIRFEKKDHVSSIIYN